MELLDGASMNREDHPHMIPTYRLHHIISLYSQACRLKLRFQPFVVKGHSGPLLDMMLILILVTTMHRTASSMFMQSQLMQGTRVLVTLQRCIRLPATRLPHYRDQQLYAPSKEQDLTRRGQNSHQVQYPISRGSQGPQVTNGEVSSLKLLTWTEHPTSLPR